jgi:catechol 2,3-dioxygenase-like lactoylglutathione lyase family enzyme
MRLQNVVIPTHSFQHSVAFYRDVLTLPVVHESTSFCFLNADSVQIAIHGFEQDSLFAPSGHGYYLDLLVDDMARVKERLALANVSVLREWTENGMQFLLISDPDGNRLELYANIE